MKKGAILFGFNSPKFNYYDMAIKTAKRINHFLDLPVTVVTDQDSINDSSSDYVFDHTVIVEPDKSNTRDNNVMWINKGRYQAYALSPYDSTLLVDTDYVINSNKLATLFNLNTDFCCHDSTYYLLKNEPATSYLSTKSVKNLWATVIKFDKTQKAEHIFDCIKMIENNFKHYETVHGFLGDSYRNDFALSIALRIVNGHIDDKSNYIPWNLTHIGDDVIIEPLSESEFNTSFKVTVTNSLTNKKEYIIIKDYDFHMIIKNNIMEIL